jgi:6-phosphogluconolactonase
MTLLIRLFALAPLLALLSACGGGSDSAMPASTPALTDGFSANTPVSTGSAGNPANSSTNSGTSGSASSAAGATSGDYAVGGSVSGMLGNGLTLQINGGSPLPVAANGAFTFPTSLLSGTSYVITIAAQPINPTQTCVLGGASGTVQSSAITNVLVTCTSAPTQFAYGGSQTGIYCFAVDAISGALAPLGVPQCDSGELVAIAVDPAGPFAYATDQGEQPLGSNLLPVAGSVRMYAIDSATGQLVRLGSIAAEPVTPVGPSTITVDPTGSFVYVGASDSVVAYAIDPSTGLLTALPGSPFAAAGGYVNELAIDSSGKFLYTANTTTNNVSALAIDATTGSLTQVPGSPFAAGDAPTGIVIDPASRFVFVADGVTGVANGVSGNVSVFQIASATGALSPSRHRSTAARNSILELVTGLEYPAHGGYAHRQKA